MYVVNKPILGCDMRVPIERKKVNYSSITFFVNVFRWHVYKTRPYKMLAQEKNVIQSKLDCRFMKV